MWKAPVESQSISNVGRTGGQAHVSFHLDDATHNRRVRLHAQFQQVFNVGASEHNIQFNIVAMGILWCGPLFLSR